MKLLNCILIVILILLAISIIVLTNKYANLKTEIDKVEYAEILSPGVTLRNVPKGKKLDVIPEGVKIPIEGVIIDYYKVSYKN